MRRISPDRSDYTRFEAHQRALGIHPEPQTADQRIPNLAFLLGAAKQTGPPIRSGDELPLGSRPEISAARMIHLPDEVHSKQDGRSLAASPVLGMAIRGRGQAWSLIQDNSSKPRRAIPVSAVSRYL